MFSQFRVDNHDSDKADKLLKKYVGKHSGNYLLVKEIGSQSGKPHLQGWCEHGTPDNTYRTHFSRAYNELGTHSKCFTKVKDLKVYMAYIIFNETKPEVKYSDCFTNYSQEEFDEMKSKLTPFVKPISKTGRKSYYDEVLQSLEDKCVVADEIQYEKLFDAYLEHAPKKVNARIIYDNLTGYTLRLEQKFPNNCKAQCALRDSVAKLDNDNLGIFFNYKEPACYKNHAVQESLQEESSEEEGGTCSESEE